MVFLAQADHIVAKEGEVARARYFGPSMPPSDPRIEPRTPEGRAALALALTGRSAATPP